VSVSAVFGFPAVVWFPAVAGIAAELTFLLIAGDPTLHRPALAVTLLLLWN
jgi:hypothetical protein